MIKKLLLTILLTTSIFAIEIVIDKSLTTQERDFIYSFLNDKIKVEDKGSYIQPSLIRIKEGSFMMGSKQSTRDERPVHKVNIDYDFYIGESEVTVEEFKKFVDDTSYISDAQKYGGCTIYDGEWLKEEDIYWANTKYSKIDKMPVVCVSYNDAKAYTLWLSKKTSQTYRLPSESEWEYVARAGTTTKYSFSNSSSNLNFYSWFQNNSNSKLHRINMKKPNLWGIYDVHGNVWEWCEDWYFEDYTNTPIDGSANNILKQNKKVLRGGSWVSIATNLRSANRFWITPTHSSSHYGFRLLREI